nr:hypothetical protein [uncultured bacterium]
MNEGKQLSDSFKELSEWLKQGEDNHYFDAEFKVDLNGNDPDFRRWLDQGRFNCFLKFQGVTAEDIISLRARFKFVIRTLAILIGLFSLLTWVLIYAEASPFWIVVISGILGSSTAAFVSTLDRWANGIEDFHGNAYPDPSTRKQRFNERFSNWLLYRPVLGIVAAALIYFGANALIPNDSPWKPSTLEAFAFIGIVAELFAKTLIEILLDAFKSLLGRT